MKFRKEMTGGNCTAWMAESGRHYFLVTDCNQGAPALDSTETVELGMYDNGGTEDQVFCVEVAGGTQAAFALAREIAESPDKLAEVVAQSH